MMLEVVLETFAGDNRGLVDRPKLRLSWIEVGGMRDSILGEVCRRHATEDKCLRCQLIHFVHDIVDGVSIIVERALDCAIVSVIVYARSWISLVQGTLNHPLVNPLSSWNGTELFCVEKVSV